MVDQKASRAGIQFGIFTLSLVGFGLVSQQVGSLSVSRQSAGEKVRDKAVQEGKPCCKEGSRQALVDGGRGGGGGRLGGGGAIVTSFEPDNGTVFCGTFEVI